MRVCMHRSMHECLYSFSSPFPKPIFFFNLPLGTISIYLMCIISTNYCKPCIELLRESTLTDVNMIVL